MMLCFPVRLLVWQRPISAEDTDCTIIDVVKQREE